MSVQAKRLILPAIRGNLALPGKQGERGASMVELAIVLSLLFLIIFGIIQFGIALNRNQGLQAAAREGARIAAVGGSEAEVGSRVRDAQSLFSEDDVLVKIDYSTNDGASYPGTNKICDDASGADKCDQTSSACGAAGIGNLVRVTAMVPPPAADTDRYAIIIPFWGNAKITFTAEGIFRCEAS